MRVARSRSSIRRRAGRNERGAVTVMVALFMTVILGCAALALDLGNLWQEKRRLHTATDAAALAAAQVYAQGSTGCPSVAGTHVADNDSTATMTSCTTGGASSHGYVTVKAKATVATHFATVLGISSKQADSSATARWGSPAAASGMRPLALCLYYPGLTAWLNLPAGPTGPSGNISVPFTNSFTGCPGSGNWGWLDYANAGSGASTVSDWILNGYPGSVSLPSNVQAQTGSESSQASAMTTMLGQTFPIAMYDTANTDSHGNNTQFHVVAAAMVKLISFQLSGNNRGFVFQFLRGTVDGICCGDGPSTGALVIGMCAFNADPTSGQCGL